MTLANYLSLFRLFVGPLFLFFYLEYNKLGLTPLSLPYILLVLVSMAEISDIADGYFARKHQQVTSLGKILDPMADSLYRISIFLIFTLPPVNLPLFLILIFLYRDVMISTLRTICALDGFALAARLSGKIKAIIQSIAIFFVIFLLILFSLHVISSETLTRLSTLAVSIAAIYSLLSGIDYIYAHRRYITKLLNKSA